MAYHAQPCPKCGAKMFDNQAPGNTYPWKPGKPIAVCSAKKATGCDGVLWAPKGQAAEVPGAPQYAPPAPAPARGPVMAANAVAVETYAELCIKHATRLVDLLTTTTELYTARVAKMPDGVAKEILSAASAEDMEKLAVTIFIELQKKGH